MDLFKTNCLDVSPYFPYLNKKEEIEDDEMELLTNHLEKNKPHFFGPYQTAQVLKKPSNFVKKDCLSFLLINFNLVIILLFGYLSMIIIVHLCLKIIRRKFVSRNNFKINAIKFLSLSLNQQRSLIPCIALMSLFFTFFSFIIFFCLISNIKTEKILVSTDEFIDSKEKLKATDKIIFYYRYDAHIFKESPETSLLFNLFKRKVKEKKVFVLDPNESRNNRHVQEIIENIGLENYVLIGRDNQVISYLVILSFYLNRLKEFIFVKPDNYYEALFTVLIRKNLDAYRKKLINFR